MLIPWFVWILIVGVIWGCTNPLLRNASKDMPKSKGFVTETVWLFTNWKYVLPFLVNTGGSVVFYITLANADLSLVVPITNSLAFLCTVVTSRLLGEEIRSPVAYLGMVLVLAGIAVAQSGR